MNWLLFVALLHQDAATLRSLPSEEECEKQLVFHTARLEDALVLTTQLENEAKYMVEWWGNALCAVRETAPVVEFEIELEDGVALIRGRRPVELWERLLYARKLREP